MLLQQSSHIICSSDKNLGPCIIERKKYISHAFDDHLSNKNNYRQLNKEQADKLMEKIQEKVARILEDFDTAFTAQEYAFITHYAFEQQDKEKLYLQMYLTFKVHKTKLSSRPIVSLSGTVLYDVGVWLDHKLQALVKKLRAMSHNPKTS